MDKMTVMLTTSVKELKGVGPSKAAALARLNIKTVDDLLHHYPTEYTFAPPVVPMAIVRSGETLTTVGTVMAVWSSGMPGNLAFNIQFQNGIGRLNGCMITWYNSGYLREVIFKGSRLMISGRRTDSYDFINPAFKVLKPDETPNPADLNTVTYPVTSGITSKDIGRLVQRVLEDLPKDFWTPGYVPLSHIHRPDSQTVVDEMRHALKYNELFFMQLGLAVRQARREQVPPNVQCILPLQRIADYFPFDFTDDQVDAANDVIHDMRSPCAMNRLLQGDVGCGKTAVAAYAAIVTAFNGAQTAILCPTEILARQHYETIRGYFERAGVSVSLMTGNPPTDCKQIWGSDIVVGTTALLNPDRHFTRNLGLVIIDEQHKFGVEQRAALRRHGNPHVLVMTATPIPRTMAMTVFGDLDISTIKTMPPGRRPVKTINYRCVEGWPRAKIVEQLDAGHQVYVVCPRIEALDDEMRAVEEVQEEYAKLFYPHVVWPLHGRCTPEYKQIIAKQWMSGGVGILVSTTVVEVGIDNPNATVMVIEGAERFGLAQLHQLRGRVGRGPDQSYCFLLSDTDSAEAHARLRAMERTNDGFEIAEQDLKQRGPGDLLSTRQHGLPDLKIADLVEDYDLLVEARKEARELVAKGLLPVSVQTELEQRFGSSLLLGDAA